MYESRFSSRLFQRFISAELEVEKSGSATDLVITDSRSAETRVIVTTPFSYLIGIR